MNLSTFKTIVIDPKLLMGVKAVSGPLTTSVMCFGGRGDQNDTSYFSVPESVATRAKSAPFIISIGAGDDCPENLRGRVLNVAKSSLVYGKTEQFLVDDAAIDRLRQWPVCVALLGAWTFDGFPHLIKDLGFADKKILSGSQDGVIRPESVEQLYLRLVDWKMTPAVLPTLKNFYFPESVTRVGTYLPTLPAAARDEGETIWKLSRSRERDKSLATAAKNLNRENFGVITCLACNFENKDDAMFDAHHPTPLAVGRRHTFAEDLEILCPTCHRRAHRKSQL